MNLVKNRTNTSAEPEAYLPCIVFVTIEVTIRLCICVCRTSI
jgi:hypothetical protein